jgi:signal transduction histidine kinase
MTTRDQAGRQPPKRELGADAGIWRRWMRAWDILFYAALLLGSVVAIAQNGAIDGRFIAVLVPALAVWYGYFGSVRMVWARSSGWAAAFLIVEATLWFLLILVNPYFIFAGFGMLAHVCRLSQGWVFGVAAIFAGGMVLQEVAEPGPANWSVLVSATFTAGFMVILYRLIDDISRRSEERQRLITELEATRAELAAAEREAGTLAERHRLARDIHDTLAQGFTSIVMLLEAADAELGTNSVKARAHIDQARKTARDNLTEARSLVWALRSERLLGSSLDDALESLVGEFRSETSVHAEFVVVGDRLPMPPASEECLLRVTQEALANVRKHAGASRVAVTLSYLDDQVALDVRDDGVGFEPASLAGAQQFGGGVGLHAMLERVQELGGTRRIESGRGEGTAISVQLPIPTAVAGDSPAVVEAS